MSHPVIFTDIDGTLIDLETYAVDASAAAVARLVATGVPIVLCSSKTQAEQETLRRSLGIPDPFIVENGSAIIIPPGYFDFDSPDGSEVVLGVSAERIHQVLARIRTHTGLTLRGYADLTDAEVAVVTGLSLPAAQRAKQRAYSETIVTPLAPAELAVLQAVLADHGLAVVSGGRFHTVTAIGSDKGVAVRRTAALMQRKLGAIVTIGIGDSANDLPLLAAVDRPYLVEQVGGGWHDVGDLPVTRLSGVGPLGWRKMAEEMLARWPSLNPALSREETENVRR